MNEHAQTIAIDHEAQAETLGWRRHLKVHPACGVLPLLPPEQLRELAADIAKHGMIEPVVLHRGSDGRLTLLDGCNRLDALASIGRPIFAQQDPPALHHDIPVRISHDSPSGIPAEVVSRNIRRRHLSEKDRVELALKVLEATVSPTNGAVAPIGAPSPIGHSPSTVNGALAKTPITGEHGQLRGSTKSVVGKVAEWAGVDRKTARRHLATNGVVKAATTKPLSRASAAVSTTAKSATPVVETTPTLTGLDKAVLALQRFSDRRELRKELRQMLRRAQALAQRYPTRRADLGDFFLQIAAAFADDSIARPAKKDGAR